MYVIAPDDRKNSKSINYSQVSDLGIYHLCVAYCRVAYMEFLGWFKQLWPRPIALRDFCSVVSIACFI